MAGLADDGVTISTFYDSRHVTASTASPSRTDSTKTVGGYSLGYAPSSVADEDVSGSSAFSAGRGLSRLVTEGRNVDGCAVLIYPDGNPKPVDGRSASVSRGRAKAGLSGLIKPRKPRRSARQVYGFYGSTDTDRACPRLRPSYHIEHGLTPDEGTFRIINVFVRNLSSYLTSSQHRKSISLMEEFTKLQSKLMDVS